MLSAATSRKWLCAYDVGEEILAGKLGPDLGGSFSKRGPSYALAEIIGIVVKPQSAGEGNSSVPIHLQYAVSDRNHAANGSCRREMWKGQLC